MIEFKTNRGFIELYEHVAQPQSHAIVLVHGYCEHANSSPYVNLYNTIKVWPGVSVARYSHPGHGGSHGQLGYFNETDYVETLKDVCSRYKTPVIIIAHSLGGLTAIRFAQTYPLLVKQLILIAPAVTVANHPSEPLLKYTPKFIALPLAWGFQKLTSVMPRIPTGDENESKIGTPVQVLKFRQDVLTRGRLTVPDAMQWLSAMLKLRHQTPLNMKCTCIIGTKDRYINPKQQESVVNACFRNITIYKVPFEHACVADVNDIILNALNPDTIKK